MKHQRLPEVRQKILSAVVAGIEVIFVRDAFRLKLPMEFRSSFIESEVIRTAAVEIDGQLCRPYRHPVLLGEGEGAIPLPVTEVDGIAEDRSQEATQRHRHILSLPRRFHDERGALCTDRRE